MVQYLCAKKMIIEKANCCFNCKFYEMPEENSKAKCNNASNQALNQALGIQPYSCCERFNPKIERDEISDKLVSAITKKITGIIKEINTSCTFATNRTAFGEFKAYSNMLNCLECKAVYDYEQDKDMMIRITALSLDGYAVEIQEVCYE